MFPDDEESVLLGERARIKKQKKEKIINISDDIGECKSNVFPLEAMGIEKSFRNKTFFLFYLNEKFVEVV
jgi:hypothetical protein